MANKSTISKNQTAHEPKKKTKKNFVRYSDLDEKKLSATESEGEEYDDTKRKGQKEWDEEYREYDEDDLGSDFGKPNF